MQDIAIFQPFFETPLAGKLEIDWHGAGEIQRMRHTGEGRFSLQRGRVAEWTGVEGELAGVYAPESIDITALRLRCDQGTLEAGVRLRDQCLQVEGLRLTAGKTGVATGSFRLPLDLRTPTRRETLFPASGALSGLVVLEQIDLALLFPASRPGLAVRGNASGSFTAGGTLAAPDLTARLAVRNLQSGAAEKVPPATGDALLRFYQDRLALSGTLAQPGLSTLGFKGEMPLDLRKALTERRIDPATPIAFSVKLPPSSAGLFAPLIPGVRMLDGRLSLDAGVNGTLEKPVIAAVNGFAMGGGFMMVERTDLRVAATTAIFEVSEAKRWLLGGYDHGHMANLAFPLAMEMALGFRFTAERFHQIGFINRLVPPEQVMEEAMGMARHLLTLPPAARVNTVHMMRRMRPRPSPAQQKLAAALHEHGAKSDLLESRAAFAETRAPNVKGWNDPADRYRLPDLD